MSIEAPCSGHWTIPDIPYGSIDRQRARTDPYLLYLVAGASFVEITSDLYAANLVEYFAGDEQFDRWLSERWEREERQHGQALRRYVETVWPEFDWDRAYQGFFAEYAPYCAVTKLGPTRALELASRCVVETGTATFYTTLARVSPEPVLRELANRIKNDEHRHYNMFLYHYRRLAQMEGTGPRAVLGTLRARMDELDQEDVYCAIKHVFLALHLDRPFTSAEYGGVRRHYARLARHHYPYRTAAQMLLRPLGLSQASNRPPYPSLPLPAGCSCPDARRRPGMGVAGRDDQGSGPGYQPAGIPPKWRRGQPPPPRRSPRRTARSRRSRLRNTRQMPAATEKVRRQDAHWYLANFTPSQPTVGAVTGRGPAGRAADLPGTGPRLGAPTRLVWARDAAITVPCKSAGDPRAAYALRIGRGPPADPMRTVAHLIVGAQTSAAAMIGGGGAPWAGSGSASSAVDARVRQSVSTLCNELAPLIQVAQGKLKITAISLVLVLGNQMPWSEGFGFAGVARKRAATADTLYRAGSLAKPLTAIAVMRLAESGAIDIDQPLRGYPQEFSIGLRFRTPTDSITVRNALSHQAVLFVTGLMVIGDGAAARPTVAKLPWS